MAIELPCSGCGQTLRVRDEDAGRQARCPQCGAVTSVPLGGPSYSANADPNDIPLAPGEPPNPYASPPMFHGEVMAPRSSYTAPHRGTTILILGILSVTCCLICGPFAWIMGSQDMKSIREGRMDPAGKTQTQVGMILGIIGTLLGGCSIILQIILAVANQ